MSGFRLLGIFTGSPKSVEATTDFLKVLSPGEFYSFYSCFSFNKQNKSFNYNPDLDLQKLNLYSDEHLVDINISAIVGKNGSGKSTLIELLYLASYNLGCEYELLSWFDEHGEPIKGGGESYQPGKEVFYKKKELFFTILYEKNKQVNKLIFDGLKISLYRTIEELKRGELIFSEVDLFEDNKPREKNFELLFYNLAINYSIYGLNSNFLGNWIKPLFHKNDGYTTPLVINPMRHDGNFDINDETDFSYNRILANLISKRLKQTEQGKKEEIYITDKQWVLNVEFILKESAKKIEIKSVENGIKGKQEQTILVKSIIETFFGDYDTIELFLQTDQLPFSDNIYTYLRRKYEKIVETYKEYQDIQNDPDLFEEKKRDKILYRLKKDNSHITYKFRQAINFLYTNYDANKRVKWEDAREIPADEASYRFTLDQLIEWMGITDNESITEFLPPSIFQTKIWLAAPKGEPCTFGDLSSGEQQYINSAQTVLYHLNNLHSVHLSANSNKVRYNDVNVILDEIELYFHPEYQQKFIQYLVQEIKNLEFGGDKGVNSVNIMFLTHSPFILSDIPASNVLRLKEGAPDKQLDQTFGANIHELLSDSFYLESTIGGLSREKINSIINFYEKVRSNSSAVEKENLRVIYLQKRSLFYRITYIIGEKIIRGVLSNHLSFLDSHFNTESTNQLINEMDYYKSKYENLKSQIEKRNKE